MADLDMIYRFVRHQLWKRIELPFATGHLQELEREVLAAGCETLLDVGCGGGSAVQGFSSRLKYSVGIDAYAPAIERAKAKGTHSDYAVVNLMELREHFPAHSFDCVLAFDVIEHLEKENGNQLLYAMEHIARKKVIVFTPNGFLPQGAIDGNPFQVHRSGWSVAEMHQRGFRVKGIHGYKLFLGEESEPRWRPHLFWKGMAVATQRWVYDRPEHAFQLFCVKDVGQPHRPGDADS